MRRRHQTGQTFVKFYCEDKQGCTMTLVVEMFSNTMLAPFIVLKGQTDSVARRSA